MSYYDESVSFSSNKRQDNDTESMLAPHSRWGLSSMQIHPLSPFSITAKTPPARRTSVQDLTM